MTHVDIINYVHTEDTPISDNNDPLYNIAPNIINTHVNTCLSTYTKTLVSTNYNR